MKRLIYLFLGILPLFMACDNDDDPKPGTYEDMVKRLSGNYELIEVFWSGTSLDLNNDGTAHWDLLSSEMSSLLGYHEKNHIATLEKSDLKWADSKPSVVIEAQLPHPVYNRKDSDIIVTQLSYLPVSIHNFYYGEEKWTSESLNFSRVDSANIFISGIDEVLIEELTHSHFAIRMHCNMYDLLHGKWQTNYLKYTFERTYK